MLFAVASYNFLRISSARQQEKWKRGEKVGGESDCTEKKYIEALGIFSFSSL